MYVYIQSVCRESKQTLTANQLLLIKKTEQAGAAPSKNHRKTIDRNNNRINAGQRPGLLEKLSTSHVCFGCEMTIDCIQRNMPKINCELQTVKQTVNC